MHRRGLLLRMSHLVCVCVCVGHMSVCRLAGGVESVDQPCRVQLFWSDVDVDHLSVAGCLRRPGARHGVTVVWTTSGPWRNSVPPCRTVASQRAWCGDETVISDPSLHCRSTITSLTATRLFCTVQLLLSDFIVLRTTI